MAFSYEKNGINIACYRVTYIGEINMITSATTVNTVYGQSAVNSTTNNKADGASFAAAFANASSTPAKTSSTPAKTSSTTSADKVTISAQAQQVSAQDDIEAEAQALAQKIINGPNWSKDLIPFAGWSDPKSSMTPSNQKLMDKLQGEFNSMFGTSASNSPRFPEVKMLMSTLSGNGTKQDFTEESLKREAKVMLSTQDLIQKAHNKQFGITSGSSINPFEFLYGANVREVLN